MAGKRHLIVIGSGGFGREALWNARDSAACAYDEYTFITSDEHIHGTRIHDADVIGDLDRLDEIYNPERSEVFIAIGNSRVRARIVEELGGRYAFATIVGPGVAMGRNVELGKGTIICCKSILTVDITIGNHVIINQAISVGHDTVIEDFVTMSPNCTISGYTHIERMCDIGSTVTTIPHVRIRENTIVGAGAVVTKDIGPNVVAVGAPAKAIKDNPI